MKHYKLLFCDLDGTLIKTRSGKTFPQGAWDMELRLEVFEAIKKLNPDYIGIVTNQGGIEDGHVESWSFYVKLLYIRAALSEYTSNSLCNIPVQVCESNNRHDVRRKPNTGMLEHIHKTITDAFKCTIDKSEILMIGDASGKKGQFSNTDLKTAQNFGIDYLDVEDFVEMINNPNKE